MPSIGIPNIHSLNDCSEIFKKKIIVVVKGEKKKEIITRWQIPITWFLTVLSFFNL